MGFYSITDELHETPIDEFKQFAPKAVSSSDFAPLLILKNSFLVAFVLRGESEMEGGFRIDCREPTRFFLSHPSQIYTKVIHSFNCQCHLYACSSFDSLLVTSEYVQSDCFFGIYTNGVIQSICPSAITMFSWFSRRASAFHRLRWISGKFRHSVHQDSKARSLHASIFTILLIPRTTSTTRSPKDLTCYPALVLLA